MTDVRSAAYTAPWIRIAILLVAVLAAALISLHFTGNLVPRDPANALVMQNALLLVVFGSAVLEHHFTKPADSAVNALMGTITLLPIATSAPVFPWSLVTAYCLGTFILAVTCVAVSTSPVPTGWRERLADAVYRPAVILGQARVLFSIVFLFGVFSFFDKKSAQAATLVAFWGVFVVIWPLRLPQLLTLLVSNRSERKSLVGHLIRSDTPGLLRIGLAASEMWRTNSPLLFVNPSGDTAWILPLYSHVHRERSIGTALELKPAQKNVVRGIPGGIYEPSEDEIPNRDEWFSNFGQPGDVELAGFVVESSEIGFIRFQVTSPRRCHDGMLVWCGIGDTQVYYQVTNGITTEEPLESDRHGYQVARASQLGTPSIESGFAKYDWFPQMNEPVFTFGNDDSKWGNEVPESDFIYGTVPNSSFSVSGNFVENFNHHTALLGVTGSGKTELAFDLIRHSVEKGIKVVCIDLTDQYQDRLSDLYPADLSIDESTARDLNEKLFDVETGKYGAGDEKKALKAFSDRLRADVNSFIDEFLGETGGALGSIKLQEISNTKATLWITELYMTCILQYARRNRGEGHPILVVVEEAHTVMPEASTMGLGDFDSKGLVGKIAQVALQGRKYGVGLVVIAQRTANVSKTVLTQCNSVLSFSGYDDTSLNFLRNVFGSEYTSVIPNLRARQVVAFGKVVRSERPIVVEVPYDAKKAR